MSDAAIEREYEERLQAAARYLEVIVTYQDGRRIKRRVFMDTPEGRQSAAKNADTWMELPYVASVEVTPVGAEAVSREARASSKTDAFSSVPSRVICCTPRMIAKPSGKRLCHSLDCPEQSGEPIPIARQHAQGRNWPPYGRVRR